MNVDMLVTTKPSVSQFLDIVVLSMGGPESALGYPTYIESVESALDTSPPPYCNSNYYKFFFDAAEDPHWLACSLITNAEREGDGATRLWSLSATSDDEEQKILLKKHAIDESSHSLGYLRLLDFVFPGAVTPEFRNELKQLSPRYSNAQQPEAINGSVYSRVPTIDDYIQMNIAEVRTTIHHIMQREALLSYCPPENRDRMIKTLEALMQDELSHVAYTGALIEKLSNDYGIAKTKELYRKRIEDFNGVTLSELENKIFD